MDWRKPTFGKIFGTILTDKGDGRSGSAAAVVTCCSSSGLAARGPESGGSSGWQAVTRGRMEGATDLIGSAQARREAGARQERAKRGGSQRDATAGTGID